MKFVTGEHLLIHDSDESGYRICRHALRTQFRIKRRHEMLLRSRCAVPQDDA